MRTLEHYAQVVGRDVIEQLRQLAAPLRGRRLVHVNSTARGGGVAEILERLVPLLRELGVDAVWRVIEGTEEFFRCTKAMHNALQGNQVIIPESLLRVYEEVNARNAEALRPELEEADVVFIHDPQPAPLLGLCPGRRGRWVWRCHIDLSQPYRPVWKYFRRFVSGYDAAVFSTPDFAQPLGCPLYIIPPSIDPLSEKNRELPPQEVRSTYEELGVDPERPVILQVSRFDRFKDPLGVIQAYRLARKFIPSLQLVLAGGGATDDPEGEMVLEEVQAAAADDPDVHVLFLPPEADRTINALQRGADVVLQKSLREGFGLTVTEAMWKGKPVIGGNAGGIRLQVIDHHTGFLVNTPEGAALRLRYLFHHRDRMQAMGQKAREFVRQNFLITRLLRDCLTVATSLLHGAEERLELG